MELKCQLIQRIQGIRQITEARIRINKISHLLPISLWRSDKVLASYKRDSCSEYSNFFQQIS